MVEQLCFCTIELFKHSFLLRPSQMCISRAFQRLESSVPTKVRQKRDTDKCVCPPGRSTLEYLASRAPNCDQLNPTPKLPLRECATQFSALFSFLNCGRDRVGQHRKCCRNPSKEIGRSLFSSLRDLHSNLGCKVHAGESPTKNEC